jgi:hypothetical protein
MLHDERPGVEENYLVASSSSNLRVEADRRGDGDMVIVAGWTTSRIGMALLRLHSEWDRAEKPRKPLPPLVALVAATMPRVQPTHFVISAKAMDKHWRKEPARRMELAQQQAQRWYMSEMVRLVGSLSSLASVRHQLTEAGLRWGLEHAVEVVPATIAYWLDQTCPHCHGLKFTQVPGAPALSAKACKHCGGTGVAPVPHGQAGRRLANYMDDCVSRAQSALKERLRGLMPRE